MCSSACAAVLTRQKGHAVAEINVHLLLNNICGRKPTPFNRKGKEASQTILPGGNRNGLCHKHKLLPQRADGSCPQLLFFPSIRPDQTYLRGEHKHIINGSVTVIQLRFTELPM